MKLARLNNIQRMDDAFYGSGEPDYHFKKRQIQVVENDFDFLANSATDLCDTPENTIVNFHENSDWCIGSYDNFKDWMCLRAEIKNAVEQLSGLDYSGYSALSANIRSIAKNYISTKIIDMVGIAQLINDCGGDVSLANESINNYLEYSEQAREIRYNVLVNYAYQNLGKSDGLKAEEAVVNERLRYKYIKRGVSRVANDSVDGLGDWLNAENAFVNNGLKTLIQDGLLSIKTGIPLQDFIDHCTEIIEQGKY